MTADPLEATPCDRDCQFNPHLNGLVWHWLLAYHFYGYQRTETYLIYVVCSKSIRIGIVVVVHWVGCVCNQS
jgi:hypothetical protein